ncbi:O-antigen/teichoic acid export membrane protein [Bradyrhizobium sp. LM3.2]
MPAFCFWIGIHHALFCDPIISSGNRDADEQNTDPKALRAIGLLAGFSILAIGAVVFLLVSPNSSSYLRIAGLSCLFFSLAGPVQLARRIMHVEGLVLSSALASAAYTLIMLCSAWMLPRLNLTSNFSYAFPFLFGNIAYLIVDRSRRGEDLNARLVPTHLTDHFRLGFSFLLSSSLSLVATNIYPFVFAATGAIEAIAGYRLIFGVIAPFYQIFGALSGFITPRIAVPRLRDIEASHGLALSLICIAPAILAIISIWFGEEAATLLFGAKYTTLGNSFPIAFASASLALAVSTLGIWLKANRRVGLMQLSSFISTAATIAFAFPLCAKYGFSGAFTTYGLANCFAAAWIIYKSR